MLIHLKSDEEYSRFATPLFKTWHHQNELNFSAWCMVNGTDNCCCFARPPKALLCQSVNRGNDKTFKRYDMRALNKTYDFSTARCKQFKLI